MELGNGLLECVASNDFSEGNKATVCLKACTNTFKSNVSDMIILSSVEPRRLLPGDHPRELYVCHHQSVPQSVVELSFKLGFGV